MKPLLRILLLAAAALLLVIGGVRAWENSCLLETLAVPSDDGPPASEPGK